MLNQSEVGKALMLPFQGTSMPGLHLYYSNRFEKLPDSLARLLADPLGSPLEQETILIPGVGMGRWLSLELARRLGICANTRFIFPRVFTSELFSRLNGSEEKKFSHFLPASETWRLLDLLSRSLAEGGDGLDAYIADWSRITQAGGRSLALQRNNSWLKLLQFAERLAETFDKYLLFRPEIIRSWETLGRSSRDADWQARFWLALYPPGGRKSPLASRDAFFRQLKEEGIDFFALPRRISLVNINVLPVFYRDIIQELSNYIEVHLFFFNPSREYWADIRSEREIGNQIRLISEKSLGRQFEPNDLYLESGNSLLASLGRGGRHFLASLMELDLHQHDLSQEPPATNMLGYIQQDIFTLTDRGKKAASKTIIDAGDCSLMVHSCHSPSREIEVLHDYLLFLFEQLEGLKPKDILVLAPDIEAYAPFIEAVFSSYKSRPSGDAESPGIPFSIANRNDYADGVIGNTFLKLLDLLESRHDAPGFVELLDAEPIRNRFGLSEEEARIIRRWVIETRIHWGQDAKSKEAIGLPSIYENTWQAGLDRLFLGYAFSYEEGRLFHGIMPYDGVEGDLAATLGKMAEFIEMLFNGSAEIKNDKTPSQWSQFLFNLLDIFRPTGEAQQEELNRLLREVRGLALIEKEAGFQRPIDFAALKYHLKKKLANPSAVGFVTGGITFCNFTAMAGIPSRVIWLLGMNYDAFPGQSLRLGFDLTMQKPKTGDPSRRDEERYLFLQTILSARDCLSISYIGQSHYDDTIIPPSATVSELLDYIDQAFTARVNAQNNAQDWMVTRHPRQPFHRSYFFAGDDARRLEKPRLFSYSRHNCLTARALESDLQRQPGFIRGTLPDAPDEFKKITVEDLVRFFRHPARYFLQKRLGIYLYSEENVSAKEKFELAGLDRYQVDQRILKLLLEPESRPPEDALQLIRAMGMLPHGAIGDVDYNERYQDVKEFVSRVSSYRSDAVAKKLPVGIEIDGYLINGLLENFFADYRLIQCFRKTDGRDLLGAWVEHVVMNAAQTGRELHVKPPLAALQEKPVEIRRTLLVTRDKTWQYRPPPDPELILRDLLKWYRGGLRSPLKLFGDLSWDFAWAVITGKKTEREALEAARLQWVGDDSKYGVGKKPCLRQCFSEINPIDEEFATTSLALFEVMIKHL